MHRVNVDLPHSAIAHFCEKWGIVEFSLFGSVTRNDLRPDSDIDVLVTFAPDACHTLLDEAEMEIELEAIFGREVDLVDRRAIEQSRNWVRRRHILGSAIAVGPIAGSQAPVSN